MSGVEVTDAKGAVDLAIARTLFLEYAQWLGFALCFQGFDAELAGLPGKYAPPQGRLLIARCEGEGAGVVALRPLEPRICEMKRLYVRPEFRGRGIGEILVDRVIAEARRIGYGEMRLDTLPQQMGAAVALYRARGFVEISAYYSNPVPGIIYLEASLR